MKLIRGRKTKKPKVQDVSSGEPVLASEIFPEDWVKLRTADHIDMRFTLIRNPFKRNADFYKNAEILKRIVSSFGIPQGILNKNAHSVISSQKT